MVEIMVIVIWLFYIVAAGINLRVLMFLRGNAKRMREHHLKKVYEKETKKTRAHFQSREGSERRVSLVYLVLTILPLIHMIPGIIVGYLDQFTKIPVSVGNLASSYF